MRNTLLLSAALGLALAATADAKTLRWSSQGDIATFDPYAHTESFTSNVQHHVYEPLVRRAQDLSIEPALATAWEIIAEDRWRFTLREGVTFHNGNPFDADDVVASIERLLHPDARARGNLGNVVGVEKVDAMTVDFVLAGAYPLLLNDLSGIFIMDREWMEEHDALLPGNVTTGTTTFATTNANGTGPFMLESYRPDSGTDMVVNPDWWDTPSHNLTRLEFRPIGSDATRVAALLSGEIDLVAPAPLQDLARIEAMPGFTVVEEPSLRLIFLGLNHRDELHAMPGEPNPMRDVRVRQALAHAIDLDTLRDRVMRGKSRNMGLMVAPPVPGYSADLDVPVPHDPDRARELMAEAGFPEGIRTRLDCSNDRYINDEAICVAIASMWTRAGIETELSTESRSSYFSKVDRGETDAYLLGWATLPAMDAFSVLRALFHTRDGAMGGNNPNALSDPRLDELTQLAATELDEDTRRAHLTEALRIVRDEMFFVPLHLQPVAWAMAENVTVDVSADEYIRLWFATVD